MPSSFHREELPNGNVHCKWLAEDGTLEQELKEETLPSGKSIQFVLDGHGNVTRESHAYGSFQIALIREFADGKLLDESYFVKNRVASRKTYEKARVASPDMPPATEGIYDSGAALLSLVNQERRQKAAKAKQRKPSIEDANRNDRFCEELLTTRKNEEAVVWLEARNHTLGEKSWANSKKFVDRLQDLGCVRIVACKIDDYGGEGQNAGNLVIELPPAGEARAKIIKSVSRAAAAGFDGYFDDGQKYLYLKLD